MTNTAPYAPASLGPSPDMGSLDPHTWLTPRYRIERKLGQGGFGETYLAYDENLDRPCVVKRLRLRPGWDAEQRRRYSEAFDREARMLARINTPGQRNIPDIYEYLPDQRCLVMKYIAGTSLAERLSKPEPLGLSDALRYTRDVCAALVYLHSRAPAPVLHRDVKPANILVDSQGQVWLIDFGLAHVLPAPGDGGDTFASAGTLGYAPAEQLRGQAAPRSDVYALAATFYALLAGEPLPFGQRDPGLLRDRLELLAPELPPQTLDLLLRALAPAPEARPEAAELLAHLGDLIALRALPPPAAPEPLPAPPDLVGRDRDLSAYAEQLRGSRRALIGGPAGVGKTALAAALAQRWPAPRHVFWHTLQADDGPESLLWSLAGFLARLGVGGPWRLLHSARGGEPPAPQQQLDYVLQGLRGLGCLVVLDDLHIVEQAAGFGAMLTRLLKHARDGDLSLLITARQWPDALRSEGAAPMLSGLNLADTDALLARLGLDLDRALTARLHELTEGNPQLLLLAAEALRLAPSPARLLERLAEVEQIERYLLVEVQSRLTPDELRVMGAVAALLGHPASRAALEALLPDLALQAPLSELGRRQLLSVSGGPERSYGQHAMLQAFFYAGLAAAERRELHLRAAAYYADGEPDPLRLALHALRAGSPARAAAAAVGHVYAAINRGQAGALVNLLAAIPAERLDPPLRAAAQAAEAELLALLGDFAPARAKLEQAIAAGAALGEPATRQAHRQRLLGLVLARSSQYAEAAAACRAGLELLADQPRPSLELAQLYIQLAEVLVRQAQLSAAEQACAAGLAALPPPPAAPAERAALLQRQATIVGQRGQVAEAIVGFAQALPLARQIGDVWLTAAILHNLGAYSYDLSHDQRAEAYLRESLAIKEQIGDLMGRAVTLNQLGAIQMARGDYPAALATFETCLQLGERLEASYVQSVSLCNIGAIQIRQGRLAQAEAALTRAREIFRLSDDQEGAVNALCRLGEAALAGGAPADAYAQAQDALEISRRLGLAAEEGWALRVSGEALAGLGRPEEADRQLAAAWQLLEAAGDAYEQALTLAARARLAHAAGDGEQARSLLRQAMELALDDPDPHLAAALGRAAGDLKSEI